MLLTIIMLFSVGLLNLKAQENDGVRLKHYALKNNLALQGYDPVSYFAGKPLKGKKTHLLKYKSVLYNFSSQTNLEKFKIDPSKYEPVYGGWCAYAMGDNGEKVEVDPETYKIINGKLYLFYNAFFNNTLNDWNKNEQNLKKKADINWGNTIK